MAVLSDNSSVRSQILPSVWMGYTLPRAKIMGEELPFKGVVSTNKGVPQEWVDEMFGVFQNGSLADFMEKYLGHTLNVHNHEQILLEADKILKQKNIQEWIPSDNRLIAIAGVDIAHNADEYGHHLFQTACFLNEQNQLPNEALFVLGRKMNPALYPEKESFEKAERLLLEPTRKIPYKWTQAAFYKWIKLNDSADYLAHMANMAALEFLLANGGQMPVERAFQDYVREHHEPVQSCVHEHHEASYYRYRPHPRRHNWRAYGE